MPDGWKLLGAGVSSVTRPADDVPEELLRERPEGCLLILSGSLYDSVLAATMATPLRNRLNRRLDYAMTESGILLHFPLYGAPRIASSLEQLKVIGVKDVIAIGHCGSFTSEVEIGNLGCAYGAVRGDGVGLYYAPIAFPAVPHPYMLNRSPVLSEARRTLHLSTDALYRESPEFLDFWRSLGIQTIDMEVSALFVVSRSPDLRAWIARWAVGVRLALLPRRRGETKRCRLRLDVGRVEYGSPSGQKGWCRRQPVVGRCGVASQGPLGFNTMPGDGHPCAAVG